MKKNPITLDSTVHRYFAVHFNQKVWQLLSKSSITIEEGYELIDYAHASNLHWRYAGNQVNQQRGMYLIARVFLAVGNPQAALIYAQKCCDIANKNIAGIKDFDYAYAQEVMWKCQLALGNMHQAEKHKTACEKFGNSIVNEEDKRIFLTDFNTEYKKVMKGSEKARLE